MPCLQIQQNILLATWSSGSNLPDRTEKVRNAARRGGQQTWRQSMNSHSPLKFQECEGTWAIL
jgi:hypothetical protein